MNFFIFIASFFALTSALDFEAEGLTKIQLTLEIPSVSADEFLKKASRSGGRILNGFPVNSDTMFPFVTDNLISWPDQTISECTGTILSNFWTITARQCMFCDLCNFAASTVMIRIGSAFRGSPRLNFWIARAEWINSASDAGHPDFALMMTGLAIPISPTASPIPLPSFPQSFNFFEGRHAIVIGWGSTELGTSPNMRLNFADVTITNRESCNETVIPTMSEYEFCARPSPVFPAGLSEGDQGGPIIITEGIDAYTIIGVLSTSRTSNIETNPLIMGLRIGQFWQYIHEVTGIAPIW